MAAVATIAAQEDLPTGPLAESSPEPPAPAQAPSPPQGEELWDCVRAMLTQPWRGNQDGGIPSSLVVFDWDDTLLPTSALVQAKRIAAAAGNVSDPASGAAAAQLLSDWELDDLLQTCAKAASEALRKASAHGKVVIITNSGFGWVHETAVRFMPSVLSELEQLDIPVISARAIFEPLGVPEPYRWKARTASCGACVCEMLCFRRIVDCFSFDEAGKTGPASLISIGDGWQERVAALMAAQETQLAMVKCLKFLEQPGVDQLAQELDLCTQVFEGLAAHPSWVEASYSYTEDGLQLEARAADTSALSGSLASVDGTVEVVGDEAEKCEELEKRAEETPPSQLRRKRRRRTPAMPLRHVMGGVRRWFQARKKMVRSASKPHKDPLSRVPLSDGRRA